MAHGTTNPAPDNDTGDAISLVKAWIELLTKGQGLLTTLTGGVGAVLPFALPVPKVLTSYMVTMAILAFPVATLSALGLRVRKEGAARPVWGLMWSLGALVSLLAFVWLLDVAPQWPLIHTAPRLVRAIAALPYGVALGLFCGSIVLLLPQLPKKSQAARPK